MPVTFKLTERLAGFSGTSGIEGESIPIIYRELIGPEDSLLSRRLDALHKCLFSKFLPPDWQPTVCNLVITIDNNLNGTAYIDELSLTSRAIAARPIAKGEQILTCDIRRVDSVILDIPVKNTDAVVVVRSFFWKRSVFYDFGPLHNDASPRDYDLEKALGQQLSLLYGLPPAEPKLRLGNLRSETMKEAVNILAQLLKTQCVEETEYQKLLSNFPWMLGSSFRSLIRHKKMDESNIPDFTAVRSYDDCHDIVELKQPFLKLFKADGKFSAIFNDAWNQAERYLHFCQRNRTYLREQKSLKFENPRCILLIGQNLTTSQLDLIRAKEEQNRLITVLTYDQLLQNARHIVEFIYSAEDRTYSGHSF